MVDLGHQGEILDALEYVRNRDKDMGEGEDNHAVLHLDFDADQFFNEGLADLADAREKQLSSGNLTGEEKKALEERVKELEADMGLD